MLYLSRISFGNQVGIDLKSIFQRRYSSCSFLNLVVARYTVSPPISPGGSFAKMNFGGLIREGLISKSGIFLKGVDRKNDIILSFN